MLSNANWYYKHFHLAVMLDCLRKGVEITHIKKKLSEVNPKMNCMFQKSRFHVLTLSVHPKSTHACFSRAGVLKSGRHSTWSAMTPFQACHMLPAVRSGSLLLQEHLLLR